MENKIPVVYSITLYHVLDKILYVDGSEGVENPVERDLAFNVKYKLQRNLDILLGDYIKYQKQRSELLLKYGKKDESDPNKVIVNEEDKEAFKNEIVELVSKEASHTFKKLTPDEVNSIKGDININANEMQVFIAYMVDDPELVKDISDNVGEALKETEEEVKEGN